jgi:transcriptional regulator GlxA family with amidase domain
VGGVGTQRRVVVVGYDGAELLDIACVTTTLAMANALGSPADPYEVLIANLGGRPVACAPGLTLQGQQALERFAGPLDTLVVSGGVGHRAAAADPVLVGHVRRLARDSRRVASLCTGASVLAAAGLLDGRRATAHWSHTAILAERYPLVQVDESVLYVDDGAVLTSAGMTAGLDLCLHVVRTDLGAHVANQLARRLVVPAHRPGGQAQFIDRAVPASDDDSVGVVLQWAAANLEKPHTVEELARRAGLSLRSFFRRAQAVTGTTPLQWLLHQRLSHAQTLLETTGLPIETVSERCGLGSAANLRRHFSIHVGVPPQQYRRAFTAPARGY